MRIVLLWLGLGLGVLAMLPGQAAAQAGRPVLPVQPPVIQAPPAGDGSNEPNAVTPLQPPPDRPSVHCRTEDEQQPDGSTKSVLRCYRE